MSLSVKCAILVLEEDYWATTQLSNVAAVGFMLQITPYGMLPFVETMPSS